MILAQMKSPKRHNSKLKRLILKIYAAICEQAKQSNAFIKAVEKRINKNLVIQFNFDSTPQINDTCIIQYETNVHSVKEQVVTQESSSQEFVISNEQQ